MTFWSRPPFPDKPSKYLQILLEVEVSTREVYRGSIGLAKVSFRLSPAVSFFVPWTSSGTSLAFVLSCRNVGPLDHPKNGARDDLMTKLRAIQFCLWTSSEDRNPSKYWRKIGVAQGIAWCSLIFPIFEWPRPIDWKRPRRFSVHVFPFPGDPSDLLMGRKCGKSPRLIVIVSPKWP